MSSPLSRSLFALAVLAFTGGAVFPTSATWRLNRLEDPSSPKVRTYVELAERDGKPAVLFLACKNDRIFPELRFPVRVGFHQVKMSYRFDSGAITLRVAPLSDDGERMFPWQIETSKVAAAFQRSKQLQVQVGFVLLKFDLRGATAALQNIRCS